MKRTKKKTGKRKATTKTAGAKTMTLSIASHLAIDRPKIIAPTNSEKNFAVRALTLIQQTSEFSGDEARVFRRFMERFNSGDMERGDLYNFLMDNPAIRKRIWESSVLEQ
jgi:hypothetical protein